MLRCRRCGCFCDPADTVNGVCDDCREEERKEERAAAIRILLYAESEQTELKDFLMVGA